MPAPTLTSFSPNFGPAFPANAATAIAVVGTNFTGATTVSVGGVAVASFAVASSTLINATIAAGTVTGKVVVTTPGGTATSIDSFVVAPRVLSVTPARGLAVGTVFVKVAGVAFNLAAQGSVQITFGGVPAERIGVASPTLLLAQAPAGDPDAAPVDVVVTNVTKNLAGPVAASGALVGGFAYARPSIATPPDFSNHSIVALVTRTLVTELRRAVLKNTHHDLHPDYANPADVVAGQTSSAETPNLKVIGPKFRESRDLSRNEHQEYAIDAAGNFLKTQKSTTLDFQYDLVGVCRTDGEASNLFREVLRYVDHTEFLKVSVTSSALGLETASFELAGVWDQRGEFLSHATRQGLYQFTTTVVVRGVTTSPDEVDWNSFWVDQLDLAVEQLSAPGAQGSGDALSFNLVENTPTPIADQIAAIEAELASIKKRKIVAVPAGLAIDGTDLALVAAVFTTEGATADTLFSLPPWAVGLTYTFINEAAFALQVRATGGAAIRFGGSVSVANGTMTGPSWGDEVTLTASLGGEWIAFPVEGDWDLT